MLFVKLPYTLATEEAERIGLDHVARISTSTDSDTSRAQDTLMAQHSAIKMLASRVRLVLEYVRRRLGLLLKQCEDEAELRRMTCEQRAKTALRPKAKAQPPGDQRARSESPSH